MMLDDLHLSGFVNPFQVLSDPVISHQVLLFLISSSQSNQSTGEKPHGRGGFTLIESFPVEPRQVISSPIWSAQIRSYQFNQQERNCMVMDYLRLSSLFSSFRANSFRFTSFRVDSLRVASNRIQSIFGAKLWQ